MGDGDASPGPLLELSPLRVSDLARSLAGGLPSSEPTPATAARPVSARRQLVLDDVVPQQQQERQPPIQLPVLSQLIADVEDSKRLEQRLRDLTPQINELVSDKRLALDRATRLQEENRHLQSTLHEYAKRNGEMAAEMDETRARLKQLALEKPKPIAIPPPAAPIESSAATHKLHELNDKITKLSQVARVYFIYIKKKVLTREIKDNELLTQKLRQLERALSEAKSLRVSTSFDTDDSSLTDGLLKTIRSLEARVLERSHEVQSLQDELYQKSKPAFTFRLLKKKKCC